MTQIRDLSVDSSVSSDDTFLIYSSTNSQARRVTAGAVSTYVLGSLTEVQDNLTATAAPTSSNDQTGGYGIGSVWVYNGYIWNCVDASTGAAKWKLENASIATSAAKSDLSGTLSETVFASVPLPANMVTVGKGIFIRAMLSATNNANTKTARVRIGGVSGTIIASSAANNYSTAWIFRNTFMRSVNQLVAGPTSHANELATDTDAGAPATYAVDLTSSTTIDFTGQLSNTGDTLSLENYSIEIIG